jgi:putative membrane protein
MINFLKGVLVGIANIMPGVSGSMFLIVLKLYDKCIQAISDILKKPKQSIKTLTPIALGVLVGTYLLSNVISYFLNNYLNITSIIFVGLIFGTIPTLIKETTKKGFKEPYLIPFFVTLTIGTITIFYTPETLTTNQTNIPLLLVTGLIIAISTIIPGISTTILLSMIGMYKIYINAISTLNLKILIPILISLLINGFIISKVINYLLTKHYGYTYFAILGFTISTIPTLVKGLPITKEDLLIGIPLSLIAFTITNKSLNIKGK